MKNKYKEFRYVPSSEFEKLIKEWVKCEKARKMMRRHFLDNVSFERIAEEMGYSTQRTKAIVYEHADFILEIIRKQYESLPIR